ncbi:MAG: tetratricopeptide repeat protein [Acidobacteriota bacterium]|nr:tetratricopeptide repeat protein [Blastocatellia bacterium]MDW8411224.1 tetratricopeptide repeat protein [Acidobacteriota bacterium]
MKTIFLILLIATTQTGIDYERLDKLILQGDLASAERILVRLLERTDRDAKLWYKLAVIERLRGQDLKAIEHIRRSLSIEPSAEAYYVLGCLLKSQDQAEALRALSKAVEIDPKNAQATIELASLFEQQGDFDKSIRLYRRAIEIDPHCGADLQLESALKEQAELKTKLSQIISSLGPYYDADEELSSYEIRVLKEGLANLQSYRSRVKQAPNDASARYALGILLRAKGELSEAIKELTAASELDPNNVELLNTLAMTLHRKGQPEIAMLHLRSALELQPDSTYTRINLAKLHLLAGKFDAATKELRTALEYDPSSSTARKMLVEALIQMRDLEGALQEAQTLTELHPYDTSTYKKLAELLLWLGHLDQALEVLRKALLLVPKDSTTLLTYAQLLQRKGRYADAAEAYQAYLRLAPQNEHTYRQLRTRIVKLRQWAEGW